MKFDTINFKDLDEKIYKYEHKSGLTAFVVQKKGYSKKYASFATHYGSINNEFIIPGEIDVTKVPDGIAHFLEHKLFEQKDGSVMDKFSLLGSSPNAYTGFNQTVYLFSCTDKFFDNFDLLLNYVQNPYFTDENVEKEKGIIGQEINMYLDNANWRVFFNLLGAFYEKHPIKIDIAGSIDSISKIDKELLYKCYNTFYHPSNMVILVVGDLEPEKVFEQIERSINTTSNKGEIKRVFPGENLSLNKDIVEQKLQVATPLFQMGFRDNNFVSLGKEGLKNEIAIKLLLDTIIGKSSNFYNSLYCKGLINSTFEKDFTIEENYAFSILGGESKNPLEVRDELVKEINRLKKSGIDSQSIERLKKAAKGKFIKKLNSVEQISHMFIPAYFKNVNLFDYYEVYDTISLEYLNEKFHNHFNLDNLALSCVNPLL